MKFVIFVILLAALVAGNEESVTADQQTEQGRLLLPYGYYNYPLGSYYLPIVSRLARSTDHLGSDSTRQLLPLIYGYPWGYYGYAGNSRIVRSVEDDLQTEEGRLRNYRVRGIRRRLPGGRRIVGIRRLNTNRRVGRSVDKIVDDNNDAVLLGYYGRDYGYPYASTIYRQRAEETRLYGK